MTYTPPRTSEILRLMPEDRSFLVKDLKEHLNGGTLARLKDAGYIVRISKKGKVIIWKLTEKGRQRRARL